LIPENLNSGKGGGNIILIRNILYKKKREMKKMYAGNSLLEK